MRCSESPGCLVQAPGYSTWNVGFGCFVCFLLNGSSTGRRGVVEERMMNRQFLFGDKKILGSPFENLS